MSFLRQPLKVIWSFGKYQLKFLLNFFIRIGESRSLCKSRFRDIWGQNSWSRSQNPIPWHHCFEFPSPFSLLLAFHSLFPLSLPLDLLTHALSSDESSAIFLCSLLSVMFYKTQILSRLREVYAPRSGLILRRAQISLAHSNRLLALTYLLLFTRKLSSHCTSVT